MFLPFALLFAFTVRGDGFNADSCQAGQTYFQESKLSDAQEQLWNCIEAGAPDRTPAFDLTLTYRELKNYELGLKRAASLLAVNPRNVDALYVAAFLNFRKGDTKRSMLLLSLAHRLDANDWRIHQLFALNYITFNMLGSADLELQRAIKLNSQSAELWYQLARLYFQQENYPESIEASRRALAIFPEYPEVYENLGLCYQGSGDAENARASFQHAVDLNNRYGRKDEWPLVDFALFYLQQSAPSLALPLLQRALAFSPASFKVNYELARTFRALGRDEEAVEYLNKALRIDPLNGASYYLLASIEKRRGHAQRARELLTQYKRLKESPETELKTPPVER